SPDTRSRTAVTASAGLAEFDALVMRSNGEPPPGGRGLAQVFPVPVGGSDLVPEPAWSELVHRPAFGSGLVVEPGPGPGVRVQEPQTPAVIVSGGGDVFPVAAGHLEGDRDGRGTVVADLRCVYLGVADLRGVGLTHHLSDLGPGNSLVAQFHEGDGGV